MAFVLTCFLLLWGKIKLKTKPLGEERVYVAYTQNSQSNIKESQDRNLEVGSTVGYCLLSCSLTHPASFLI